MTPNTGSLPNTSPSLSSSLESTDMESTPCCAAPNQADNENQDEDDAVARWIDTGHFFIRHHDDGSLILCPAEGRSTGTDHRPAPAFDMAWLRTTASGVAAAATETLTKWMAEMTTWPVTALVLVLARGILGWLLCKLLWLEGVLGRLLALVEGARVAGSSG
jgi:hypothetical protein